MTFSVLGRWRAWNWKKNFKCHYASWKCHPSKHQASEMIEPQLCSSVLTSHVTFCSPVPASLHHPGPEIHHRREKSHAWLTWIRVRRARLIICWQVFVDPGNQWGFWCHSKRLHGFISSAVISCGGPGWCHENTKKGDVALMQPQSVITGLSDWKCTDHAAKLHKPVCSCLHPPEL